MNNHRSSSKRGLATLMTSAFVVCAILCFMESAEAKKKRSSRQPAISTKSSAQSSAQSSAVETGQAKRKKKKSAANQTEDDLPLNADEISLMNAGPIAPEEELAVRKIGVALFALNAGTIEGWSEGTAARTCRDIAGALSLKSFYLANCLDERPALGAPTPVFIHLAEQHRVDAILTGALVGERMIMILYSGRSGRAIADYKLDIPASLTEEGRKRAVDGVVDLLVQGAPYRGFATLVDSNDVHVNLGSRHGIAEGQILQVFEFAGSQPTFASSKTILGTVVITKVKSPELAIGRIVDRFDQRRGPFPAFTKVSHVDVEPPRQSASARMAMEGLGFLAGIEMLSIKTRPAGPDFANRAYTLNSTPFVNFGIGAEKWFGQFWYGRASNPDESVSYVAVIAAYQLKYWGGFRSGFSFSVGGAISQFSAATKVKTAVVELTDSSRYSPYFEFRYQWVPNQRFRLFTSVETFYPFVSSDQDSAMLPTSMAFGLTPGLRFSINDWISAEGGVHLQHLSLPLQENRGVTEAQTGFFVRALLML